MKTIPAQTKVICQNEKSIFNYFAWPTVGRLPNGALAMVCSGFRTRHVDPFGKGTICYSYDEGQTWTPPAVIIDTPQDDRDCGITAFDGKTMVTTFNNGIKRQLGMMREVSPLVQAYVDSIDCEQADADYFGPLYCVSEDGYTFGDIKKLPVQNPHGLCPDNDGGLFLIGNPFVLGKSFLDLECYSMDENENFTFLSRIPSPEGQVYCEAHAIVLEDRIIAMIRENKTFRLKQHTSFDGGRTWDEGHYIDAVANGAPPHIMRHSNGTLICVYGRRMQPYGEMVMFSDDNGETWDADYYLYYDAPHPDLGYPATVELNDGSLLTVYYQREEGHDNCVIMQSIWKLPEKYNK